MIKAFCFDLFGTVINMATANAKELAEYGKLLKDFQETKIWKPWNYPLSWVSLKAFSDSKPGLDLLRAWGKEIYVLSNGPMPLTVQISKNNGLNWTNIIPLEMWELYKPDQRVYDKVPNLIGFAPCEIAVVTANEHFGDLEGAFAAGMKPILIRNISSNTILNLAKNLEY